MPHIAGRPVQIKNFPSLYSELQQGGIAKWREIGTQFGFELYELDAISAGQSDDSEANMTKVFELWKQQSLKQTWLDVIEAVSATGHNPQLCEDLRETYQAGLLLLLNSKKWILGMPRYTIFYVICHG